MKIPALQSGKLNEFPPPSPKHLAVDICMHLEVSYSRAVANGRVGRVLTRPIVAPEETTPKKLTFATVLSFAKILMFIAFFGICLKF